MMKEECIILIFKKMWPFPCSLHKEFFTEFECLQTLIFSTQIQEFLFLQEKYRISFGQKKIFDSGSGTPSNSAKITH